MMKDPTPSGSGNALRGGSVGSAGESTQRLELPQRVVVLFEEDLESKGEPVYVPTVTMDEFFAHWQSQRNEGQQEVEIDKIRETLVREGFESVGALLEISRNSLEEDAGLKIGQIGELRSALKKFLRAYPRE
ncbi:hypothetical protein FB451DRAFT_1374661 [Mycena latifolia]|nr:hypothetical protein FB451DRAFT_1374661 [Mycena latifolia]